jgi:hypothetical protein
MHQLATLSAPDHHALERDALADRLLHAAATTFDLFAVYIGDRLGFYEALAAGPLTSAGLASRTGTHARYAREWLEHQVVSGFVRVDDPGLPPEERLFSLPVGHAEVLAERESLSYLAPLAQLAAGVVAPIDDVVQAYRDGHGIPFEHYGRDAREGQARMNRTAFLYQLGQEWLPAIPGLEARLRSGPSRVADIGCGAGWSSIGVARCYPLAQVDGFDLDDASIALARVHARDAGLDRRVRFDSRDASDPALAGQYDLVMACEAVHDMADPVGALATMRRLVRDGGTVFMADERVADTFDPQAGRIEALMYGFSLLHCLPSGMCGHDPAGTGTVMRTGTLTAYAERAGFAAVDVLPIDHPLLRFYRLR